MNTLLILADIIDILGVTGIIVAAIVGFILSWPSFKKSQQKGREQRAKLKARLFGKKHDQSDDDDN